MSAEKKNAILKGSPTPLGVTRKQDGFNFALFSEHASGVTLCLFNPGEATPFQEINLDPKMNKTDKVWHVLIKGLATNLEYGYRVDGPMQPEKGLFFNKNLIVSDPYALSLATSHVWGQGFPPNAPPPRGRIVIDTHFNWDNTQPPRIPTEHLIIYEMHVRAFTYHSSSRVPAPGTFLAMIDKIPYFKEIGVNCLELMPIFEFNECENPRKNPLNGEQLYNYWGYSTVNFFSPMSRYAFKEERLAAIEEFKTMVREMHRNKIEVILDVVYNHTAEGNENGPVFSFRGIDNPDYYMMTEGSKFQNFTGCGNTFNCNHPACQQFIIDSLRYWVLEMGVDGFRFDLASIFTRDPTGKPIDKPPVIHAINRDPALANVKLIAEAWDAAGLYQVGSFPGEGKWLEWNGVYRDSVRRFIKGSDGCAGSFANALCGSQNIYGKEHSPYHSVNFITAHDGFTLRDLVSYNSKHNEANGEENRDGADNNDSWDCGAEGETHDHGVLQLRERQMRNFHVALMLSLGTPMILMGDEYGHTRKGNNNTWCQDNELNWFLWDKIQHDSGFFRFFKLMIHFRKRHSILGRAEFLSNDEIDWHGQQPFKPNWDPSVRMVAYTLKDARSHEFLYVAFNAHFHHTDITLPPPPPHKHWYKVIDTYATSPGDFIEDPKNHPHLKHTYSLPPYSALVLQAL